MPKIEKYIEKKRVRGTDFITGTDKDGNVIRFSGAFFIREIVNESNYLSLVLDEQEARIAADELLDDKISVMGEQLGIRISQNESGLVQLESNINNELYGPGGITESYSSAITQSAEAISLSVEKKLYGEGGIEESYSSLIHQTAQAISLSVDTKLYGEGGIEESYSSLIHQTAQSISLSVDTKLYGPGGIEENYSSLIQQTAQSIVLSVESEMYGPDGIQSKYTSLIQQTSDSITLYVSGQITDLDGRITTNTSSITQLSDSIDLSVFTNGKLNAGILIESVNDYEGAIKIAADKVQIDGSTTFAPGYNPYTIQAELEQYKTDNDDAVAAIDQLSADFSGISGDIEAIEEFNDGLLDRINGLAVRKNARYISPTEPVLPEGEEFSIGDEWLQEIEVPIEGSEEVAIEYKSQMWFGDDGWKPNETKINGARIETGTIDAASIITQSLFSKEIGGVELNVVSGSIGGFTIDNMLVSKNDAGQGLTIDPATRSILLDDMVEGYGASRIAITAKGLTPEARINNGGGLGFSATVDSAEYNIRMPGNVLVDSDNTRAGVSFVQYIGKAASNKAQLGGTIPTQTSGFSVKLNTSYTFDLPYSFRIYHNGGSRNGKKHKLHGDLRVSVTASLIGVHSSGVSKALITPISVQTVITRSTNSTEVSMRPIAFKTSFYSDNSVAVYWRLDIDLDGDLTYQQWTSELFGHYWMTSEGMGIDYRGCVPKGLSMDASVGLLELTTSGLQFAWSKDRFFRIDGPNEDYFVKSTGKWVHDGTFQINGSDIVTIDNVSSAIASDLSAYAMKSFVTDGYYDKVTSDGRFAKKEGDEAQDFNVKDLIIHGQVNQWLAQQLVVDDARIQVNRKQDGVTADSGLVIYDKDTSSEVSRLVYDVNGVWKAGGDRLFTEAYNPKLGGYSAENYPRKAEAAVVTGAWTFEQSIEVNRTVETGESRINFRTPTKYRQFRYDWSNEQFQWWTESALRMNLTAGGFLGIGLLTAPSERLHVVGNGLFTGNLSAVNTALSGTLSVAQAATFGGNTGTSNFVSQMQGWRVTPQGQADFRHIFTDELQAKAFTADISQALVGSDVLTKSVAKLAQNWATTANGATSSIYVEELEGFPDFQVFAVGDRLLLRLFDRAGGGLLIKNIWATVASYVGTTKNVQRYTITVNSGGATGQTVYAGSMILDYGTPGSGVIERTVLDQQGSPYSRVSTWTGSPDNPANYTLHYQSGNLNGISNASGWGVYSQNSFLTGKLLVGDLTKAGQFMEYANGQLNIKGKITVTGGNAATKAEITAAETSAKSYADGVATAAETSAKTFATAEVAAVQVGVRNLIIRSTEEANTWVNSAGDIVATTNHATSDYIKVEPNKTYTLSKIPSVLVTGGIGGYWRYAWYDENKVYIARYAEPSLHILQWKIPSNAHYVRVSYPIDSLPKFEKGNRATDWTPAPEDVPSALEYLATALVGDTNIAGGLVTTNLLMVKDTAGTVRGGMSGLKSDNVGFWTGGSYEGAISNNANVIFRKDGSFSLADGKIIGTSDGSLSVDGGVVTGAIESSNYNGTLGSRFDLHNGHLLIGDAIRMSGDTSEIQVRSRDTGLDSFRIGDFPLTPTAFAGAGVDVLLSSSPVTVSPAAGSYQLNRTVYVSDSGALMTSTSYISNSMIVGGTYNLHAYLKVTLSPYSHMYTIPIILGGGFVRRGNGIKIQLKNGNTVVWEQNVGNIPVNGVIPLSISTSFQAASQSLQLIITIDGEFEYRLPDGTDTRIYNTTARIERFDSSSRLVLRALVSRMEFSTKGMQAVFSNTNYFRCDSTRIQGRGIHTFTSPNGNYILRVSNDGIEKSTNSGDNWTPL